MQDRVQKYKDLNCFVWGCTLTIYSFGNATNLKLDLVELCKSYPKPDAITDVKVMCELPTGVVILEDSTKKLIIETPPLISDSRKPIEHVASTNLNNPSHKNKTPAIPIVKTKLAKGEYKQYRNSFDNGFI